ncbi:MAG: sugar ABC transporter substrate-binding protein [Proteobacteria bacterium]|nr:sugar ABC transporter substrate-binding protein [Pseudomonadota bacterium]
MHKKIIPAALCLMLSCSAQADGEKIAVFTKNLTNPLFASIRAGADNAAKQMNATTQHYVPTKPDSIPEQMSAIEDVVVKKPDAIVFIPVDSKAMVPGVNKINAANIPVVNINDRAAGGKFVSFIGGDDYELGLATARFLLKTMGGKGNVVIIEGVKGASTNQDRIRGFKKALEESAGVKLLATQTGNYQRLQALQVMENLMQTFPQIDGVLSANDAMATGVIEALAAANRKALVIGVNGTGIDEVKQGKLLATGDYAGFQQGCLGAMAAIRHLRKLPVPAELLFPPILITQANVASFEVPMDKRVCPKWEEIVKK